MSSEYTYVELNLLLVLLAFLHVSVYATVAMALRANLLNHGLRVQTGKEILMTSRKVVNIVINSEREANADLLCG